MELTYFGNSCVRLRGRDVQVVVDPPPAKLPGLAKAKPDLVVHTHGETDTEKLRPRDGHSQEVAGPGEFEVNGVSVRGFPAGETTIMRVEVDDVRVVSLGALARQLTEDEIDSLGHVDVLVVPVGGSNSLDAHQATKLTRAVEPAIVIPLRAGGKGDGIELFVKEMGMAEGWSAQPKLNLTGAMASSEETRVVVLEAR